jgi:hypothetical protein
MSGVWLLGILSKVLPLHLRLPHPLPLPLLLVLHPLLLLSRRGPLPFLD